VYATTLAAWTANSPALPRSGPGRPARIDAAQVCDATNPHRDVKICRRQRHQGQHLAVPTSDKPATEPHNSSTRAATPAATAALAARAIRRYQTEVSAKTAARCHFVPSCSNYGLQAVERFGFLGGILRIIGRLARCRTSVPWGTLDAVAAR
jgi:putative membrane protein insertion efficiency factor